MTTFLAEACKMLLSDCNDFWVLGALTDQSFEEGERSKPFKEAVDAYEQDGIPRRLLNQLRDGINGNLARELRRLGCGRIVRNKWKGQDLEIYRRGGTSLATAEAKQIFDFTLSKYYDCVVADVQKLMLVAEMGYAGELFLIVFFTHLPEYDYPSGTTLGKWHHERSFYRRCLSISEQFQPLVKTLGRDPTWPRVGPHVRSLECPSRPSSIKALTRLFEAGFKPDVPWKFDPSVHIRGAEVGVAIWRIDPCERRGVSPPTLSSRMTGAVRRGGG